MSQQPVRRRPRAEAGFSLVELLAVLALGGIILTIAIPLVNEQVRIADVRQAADQIGVDLRAARMIAVSKHKTIDVTVSVDPVNTYAYEGTDGSTRLRTMPKGVTIKTTSSGTISFKPDGSVASASNVVIESRVSTATERWTITVNTLGLAKLAHQRI